MKKRLQAADRLFEEQVVRLERLEEHRANLEIQITKSSELAEAFEVQKGELSALVEEAIALRDKAQSLVDGGTEGESSVADIQKAITDVATKVAARLVKIDEALSTAKNSATAVEQAKTTTVQIQAEARAALDEANRALRGSTQAGLAESFIAERDSKLYGLILYGGALTVALIGASIFAIREVIPAVSEFTKAIAIGNNNIGALAISLSIRTILLAPFVFLAWFAAVQYRRIDLLRIDYAAKVAVAKAYVGYKDEVKGDPKLLTALKHFLIQRFGEHPVRLVFGREDEEIPLHVFGIGTGDGQTSRAGAPQRRGGQQPNQT